MLRFCLSFILWSTLTVNWSPRTGSVGTVLIREPSFGGVGTNCSRSTAVGSMQASGIWLLGKMVAYAAPSAMVPPPIAVLAAWQPGRLVRIEELASVPENVPAWFTSEKSAIICPFTVLVGDGVSCELGTVTAGERMPWRIRRPSYEAKKKVRSFLIGPPNVPPNWF